MEKVAPKPKEEEKEGEQRLCPSILYWNVQYLVKAGEVGDTFQTLKDLAKLSQPKTATPSQPDTRPDFICLTEPRLRQAKKAVSHHLRTELALPGYKMMECGAYQTGGVALYYKEEYTLKRLDNDDHPDVLIVKFELEKDRPILLALIYRSPTSAEGMFKAALEEVSAQIADHDKENPKILVLGDFNIKAKNYLKYAKHPVGELMRYREEDINLLAEFIKEHGLCQKLTEHTTGEYKEESQPDHFYINDEASMENEIFYRDLYKLVYIHFGDQSCLFV